MHYLVKGESIEELLAGKTPEEMAMYVQQIIKPSLEALWKFAEEKKVVVGVVTGERECAFVIDTDSNAGGRQASQDPPVLGRHERDGLAPPVVPVGARAGP